ncbi:YdeI/OmpD-associated family protein [Chitinophaga varians]|uniref:YdeI/OmpD-associated family protein n=1 Tax=Chitinophaga varians TaxID=2202339 RepID=UPI00165FB46F|nr:YdeI/OmpD-associated family protein [Chitinophaga varians]MBC9915618.1 YdeI/OmpD-associated family protein [Chitinophaga varians]
MSQQDARIDAYILKSAGFAQPILEHMRALVHKACPEAEETIKWGMPYFTYEGQLLCCFAAFKAHCSFIFWKGALMDDPDNIFQQRGENGMGQLGKIASLKDLPSDKIFIKYLKAAAKISTSDLPPAVKKAAPAKKELEVPDWLLTAIKKNKKAWATFEAFSYSHQKEYVEWITSAKTEATRNSRLADALTWMAEGKIRNWKYVK